jgi:hypothetical protein
MVLVVFNQQHQTGGIHTPLSESAQFDHQMDKLLNTSMKPA